MLLLLGGRVANVLELVNANRPNEVVVRASLGPTPFSYRYLLRGEADETELTLEADVDLDGLMPVPELIAAPIVKHGVDTNLASLKALVERR